MTFLPKPGSTKFRPISLTSTLCKTFERMVQKRLEFLVEKTGGYQLISLASGGAASVIADVLQGFGRAESSLALALDLKGAFNVYLPGVLLHQLF